jgi:hypothetical protein
MLRRIEVAAQRRKFGRRESLDEAHRRATARAVPRRSGRWQCGKDSGRRRIAAEQLTAQHEVRGSRPVG